MKSNRLARISTHLILGIAALLLLILRPTPAQSPTPLIIPPTTTIKVATRLVTVDVVALDSKGRPVQGLTKDDFELSVDGKPQPIGVFSVEGSLIPHAPVVAAPQAPIPPLATLPLNTFTNRPSDAPATATIILIDLLNTATQNLMLPRLQMAKFIRQMQPQDRVALYTMAGNVQIVQDFTSDSALLLKALESVRTPQGIANLAAPTGGFRVPSSARSNTAPRGPV